MQSLIPHNIHTQLSCTPWLSFRLSLLLLLFLQLLLLLLILLLILPLQALNLRFRLRNRLKESFQPSLLSTLQILLQSRSTGSDSILAKSLLCDQKLNQAVNVGSFPFEFAFWVCSGADIGVEEEFSRIGIGPVVWDDEFLFFA
jgi:hypothetical protein